MALTPHQPAPDFSAPDQNGQLHTLADFSGQWLLLYFYPEDDTPGCTTEACNFQDHLTQLKPHLTVVGVSADTVDSHRQFATKYGLTFPLLADPDQTIIKAYGADGLIFNKRVTFLIDPQGKVAKIYPKVDPQDHVEEILNDLTTLTADPKELS